MPDQIVIRSRKQPYVVFGVLLTPVFALGLYAGLHSGDRNSFIGVAFVLLMLCCIYLYLSSLKLALSESTIQYRKSLRTAEIPIGNVSSITHGQKPFGKGLRWTIHLKDHSDPITVNIANFRRSELKAFSAALLKRDPSIRISV